MMKNIMKRMKTAKSNNKFFEMKQELDWLHTQMKKNRAKN